MAKHTGPPLPAQPFIDWCNAQLDRLRHDETIAAHTGAGSAVKGGEHQVLADRLGITERTLYRYLRSIDGSSRPTETYGAHLLEDMLEHAGLRLADVYPDTEVDVELETDAYCASCRDIVTPINGQCPWCDRQTTDDKPKRLFCATCDAAMFPALDGDCWRCGGRLKSMPWISCGCGCGEEIVRFDTMGREIGFVRGHAPRTLERTKPLDAEPFAAWLEAELRNLDPIQALARRTGLHRQELLDILSRRIKQLPSGRISSSLWRASREGQGKGMPPRPHTIKLGDLYPDAVRSKKCPRCGGGKAPHAEMCKQCRRRAGYPRGERPTSVTPDLVEEARRLRLNGVPMKTIAEQLQPRTRCTNAMSVAHELRRQFQARGWSTTDNDELAAAA